MWRRFLSVSLAAGCFVFLCLLVWRQERERGRFNVIFLSVESLRADMVRPEVTPRLLEAAEQGFAFTQHRAVSGWTGTNMVTLLSGLSPFQSGVHTRGQSVASGLRLPLEELADQGYRVAGLQGFMAMDIYAHLGLNLDDAGQDLLFWLAGQAKAGRPFFLWEHYLHTHLPYRAGDQDTKQNISSPGQQALSEHLQLVTEKAHIQAGSVTFNPADVPVIHDMHEKAVGEFDVWFDAFWQFFRKSGLNRKTILVVTADHGDEHGERGNVGHASTSRAGHLHEEIVRVPLFIWLPDVLRDGLRAPVAGLTSHEDIMPTILARLGLEPSQALPGRDLFGGEAIGSWRGITSGGGFAEEDPRRISYFEYALLQDEWKLLWRRYHDGRSYQRLYSLRGDPGESSDLLDKHPEKAQELLAQLEPSVRSAVNRPVLTGAPGEANGGPVWIFPVISGQFGYDELKGRFYLEWQGEGDTDYVLQYRAGEGDLVLEGELQVRGPRKDFGTLSRRYWQTWIVPMGKVSVRVRRADSSQWSGWLHLEAAQ